VIALTASDREEDRQNCLDAGMNAFLPKPFNYDQLVEEIRNLGFAPPSPCGP
jgi:CheY-like chemotaxis protein